MRSFGRQPLQKLFEMATYLALDLLSRSLKVQGLRASGLHHDVWVGQAFRWYFRWNELHWKPDEVLRSLCISSESFIRRFPTCRQKAAELGLSLEEILRSRQSVEVVACRRMPTKGSDPSSPGSSSSPLLCATVAVGSGGASPRAQRA